MANVYLAPRNWVDEAFYPVTFSGGAWSLPLTNLRDEDLSTVARTASAMVVDTQCVVDLGAVRQVAVIYLPPSNLTTRARFRVGLAKDDQAFAMEDWRDVYPEMWAWGAKPWGYPNLMTARASAEDAAEMPFPVLVSYDTAQYARYVKLEFDDPINPYGSLEFARLFICPRLDLGHNASYGASFAPKDSSRRSTSMGGGDYYRRGQVRTEGTVVWEHISEASIWGLQQAITRLGTSRQVLFSRDLEDLEHRHLHTGIVTIERARPLELTSFERGAIGVTTRAVVVPLRPPVTSESLPGISPAVNDSPADGATVLTESPVLAVRPFYSLYGQIQAAYRVVVTTAADPAFAAPLYDSGEVPSATARMHQLPAGQISLGQGLIWRWFDKGSGGQWAAPSTATGFSTPAIAFPAPEMLPLDDGETVASDTFTMTASAFAHFHIARSHAKSWWEISDDGFVTTLYSTGWIDDLTAHTMPAGVVPVGATLERRVRFQADNGEETAWSAPVAFIHVVVFLLAPDAASLSFEDRTGRHAISAVGAPVLSTAVTDPWGGGRKTVALDGASALRVADHPDWDTGTAYTVEAWVRPTAWGDHPAIVGQWVSGVWPPSSWLMAGGPSSGGAHVYTSDGIASARDGPALLPLQTWSHLAMVVDETTVALWCDGTLVVDAPRAISQAGTAPLTIGATGEGSVLAYPLTGHVGAVRITRAALAPSQFMIAAPPTG